MTRHPGCVRVIPDRSGPAKPGTCLRGIRDLGGQHDRPSGGRPPPRRPVLTFWLIAVALEVVLGLAFLVSGAESAIEDGLSKAGIDFGSDLLTAGRVVVVYPAALLGVALALAQVAAPDLAVLVVARIRGGRRPLACGRQTVPSVVEGGRRAQGTPDLARRRRRLLRLQPGQRPAAPGIRAAGPRLALLLEHAGAASRRDVPRCWSTPGGERVARVRAPGPAPDPRTVGCLPHRGAGLGVMALPGEVRRLHRLRTLGSPRVSRCLHRSRSSPSPW